ncbi:MAG: hypothetical protein DSM106950_42790 [Stigonema ocellatum SAG 48.90 = DSM 106950]|nr:hypothetical protein [Stigonema ocellatum SAG 48.90 = DSM 106950]
MRLGNAEVCLGIILVNNLVKVVQAIAFENEDWVVVAMRAAPCNQAYRSMMRIGLWGAMLYRS